MKRFFQKKLACISDYFKEKSIQFAISTSFTAVAAAGLIFMGSALIFSFGVSNEATVSEYNKRLLAQVNVNLDNYIRSMMKISDAMYYRVIKNVDIESPSINRDMNLLYEPNRDIVSIALFAEDGSLISATPLSIQKKFVAPQTQDWFQNAMQEPENLHFSTPHVQNLFDDADDKFRWVVSLSRAVELTKGGDIQRGILLVDINFSGMEQLCKNVNLGESGYVYLVDRNGELIYHPRQELIYSSITQENNQEAVRFEDGNHKEKFLNQTRLVTVKTMGYTGWKIIGVTPMRDVTANYSLIAFFMLFLLIFTILLLISINQFVSSKIAKPILALETAVKGWENGNFEIDVPIGGSFEIRRLGASIRLMIGQMHKLMGDIVIEQEQKRKNELDALQAQINPHFLYNTLDSIVWMVENGRYQEAITMVTSLAGFFRISLSKGRNIITVENELTHAKNYIVIQHMRFKDKFTFQIHMDESVRTLATIKLIVQPLVENAVYHGMEFMDGDGKIEINAYQQQGDLYIAVKDNGPGMPDEVASSLLIHKSAARGKGSGIGLKNVQERIQLYFGTEYGLEIHSEPDVGTTVTIHLPSLNIDQARMKGGELL